MLCQLCKGSRWLISFNPMEWWACPACEATGTRQVFGPEFITYRMNKNKPK